MSITGSGIYFLTFEKIFIDTLGESIEAEDNDLALVEDGYTPAYDTHDFAADLTNEITGGNYAREAITTTELTVSSGVATLDAADTVYDNSGSDDVTITDAMGAVEIFQKTNDADSPVFGLWDFVSAASSSNSTFTVQWNASGRVTVDLVP
jgi:hypothetical protein